jgi:hypothetical protein
MKQREFIKYAYNIIRKNIPEVDLSKVKFRIRDRFKQKYSNITGAFASTSSIVYETHTSITMSIDDDLAKYKAEKPKDYQLLIDIDAEFFNSMNIEVTDCTMIIAILLHEIGHIKHMQEFSVYTTARNYIGLINVNDAFINSVCHIECVDDGYDQYAIKYHFNPSELYAEMFKYKYFMKIWNIIKQNNDIINVNNCI